MEKSCFFNAESVSGTYDREYDAKDLTDYIGSVISSGVMYLQSSALQVVANGDMTVTLKPGVGFVKGAKYENTTDLTITLDAADGTLDRIDRISFTLDHANRQITSIKRSSALSYSPIAPTCRRTDDYEDYVLADIYVTAGATSITQAVITDQRLNDNICGIVVSLVNHMSTETLYLQYESWFANFTAEKAEEFEQYIGNIGNFEEEQEAYFLAWMQNVMDQLSENAAGHLQLEHEQQQRELENAYQGVVAKETTFNTDGSITEVGLYGTKETTFNADGTITEKFTNRAGDEVVKTTTFNADGSISETIE